MDEQLPSRFLPPDRFHAPSMYLNELGLAVLCTPQRPIILCSTERDASLVFGD